MNMIIVALVAVIVAIGGTVAAIFFTPLKDIIFPEKRTQVTEVKEEAINLSEVTFLQLPELIVNLRQNSKGKTNILKATFVLELIDPKDKDTIDHLKPLIVDQLQTYLRELQMSDVEGTAGLERVRNELKNRVLNVIAPVKIRSILYKEFLVQ
jgi:flagellar FliL protein